MPAFASINNYITIVITKTKLIILHIHVYIYIYIERERDREREREKYVPSILTGVGHGDQRQGSLAAPLPGGPEGGGLEGEDLQAAVQNKSNKTNNDNKQ